MATVKLADSVTKLIVYIRVSTQKQGRSGLGLDAQLTAVNQYVAARGGVIVKEYREVESGKINERPELAKALAHARRIKATLIFAKLDRLARNARFLLGIVEDGVERGVSIVFCDFPDIPEGPQGKFILTNMAAVAELEAGLISERTTNALAEYKENGYVPRRIQKLYPDGVPAEIEALYAGKLGAAHPDCRQLTYEDALKGTARAAEQRTAQAKAAYEDIAPFVAELRAEGLSLSQIAEKLNEEGHTTRQGAAWNKVQVMRVLKLAA